MFFAFFAHIITLKKIYIDFVPFKVWQPNMFITWRKFSKNQNVKLYAFYYSYYNGKLKENWRETVISKKGKITIFKLLGPF